MLKTVSTLRRISPLSRRCLPQKRFLSSCLQFPKANNPSNSLPPNTNLPLPNPCSSYSCSFSVSRPFSHSCRKKKFIDDNEDNDGSGDDDNDRFIVYKDPKSPPKLFVVQPRLRPEPVLQAKLSEALNLAGSLEERRDAVLQDLVSFDSQNPPPHIIVQNPAARSTKVQADTYFGQGTVDTIKTHLTVLESEEIIDAVFVNTILSGIQQRNLERAWGKPVLDRVGLIIEIFNAHAQTKEAKLQAELAALMYKRTRLVRLRGTDGRSTFGGAGEIEVVSARGRGSGGRGFISGAGETELQLQRRRIQERRNNLFAQIEEVRRTRALQRSARKRRGGLQGQGLATVAVVGYTNAGKSTLVSALSDSDLYSDDRLFATVDPRVRGVVLPSGRKVLLSDTVGFISDLPVQLVEAFHATLEEVVEADLLVHVLDLSAVNLDEQRSSVLQVLQQLGVSEERLGNMIEVWNKIDLLGKSNETKEDIDQGEDGIDGSYPEVDDIETTSESQCRETVDDDGSDGFYPEEDEDRAATGLQCGEGVEDVEDGSYPEADDCEASTEFQCREVKEDYILDLASREIVDDQLNKSRENLKGTLVDTLNSSQHVQHIETSAITGVGLQELLYLIDEKLSTQRSLEKKSYDRKWRPPRSADVEAAVEH